MVLSIYSFIGLSNVCISVVFLLYNKKCMPGCFVQAMPSPDFCVCVFVLGVSRGWCLVPERMRQCSRRPSRREKENGKPRFCSVAYLSWSLMFLIWTGNLQVLRSMDYVVGEQLLGSRKGIFLMYLEVSLEERWPHMVPLSSRSSHYNDISVRLSVL